MNFTDKIYRRLSKPKIQMISFDDKGFNPHIEEMIGSDTNRSFSDTLSDEFYSFKQFNQMTDALKDMFERDPDLVDRIVLEIGRYLQREQQQAEDVFTVDGKSQNSRQMIALRYFKKNMENYPKWAGLVVNPNTVDFLDQYALMNEAGIGLTLEEAFGINLSTRIVSASTPHIKLAKFWGKIYGTIKDYYVLECELTTKEAITRNQKLADMYAEKEKNKQLQEKFSFINVKTPSEVMSQWEKKLNIVIPDSYEIHELDEQVAKLKKKPSRIAKIEKPPRPKIEFTPQIETKNEPIGAGLNKKLYLVSNVPYGDWMELPFVTPQQIVLSKQIKKNFTGIINQEIDTIPPFPGNEKCYLRAQIARISSGTHISPIGFYHFGMEEELGEDAESAGGCTLNMDYSPVPLSDLGGERGVDYWVHHAEYILDEGRITHWSPVMAARDEDEEGGEDFGMEDDFVDNYPKLLTPVSCDTAALPVSPWTVQTKENYFVNTSAVVARSNLWPGAFAYTQDMYADTVYIGWGHKEGSHGVPDYVPPAPQMEYPVGPDVIELVDPTVEFTKEWIAQHTPPPPPDMTGLMGEGGEDGLPLPGEVE